MAHEAISVDEAVGLLQTTSSANGGSVFDHLTDVVAKILAEPPRQALDLLETSYILKRTTEPCDAASESAPPAPSAALNAERAEAYLRLLRAPEPEIDAETGEVVESESPNEYTCQDVVQDNALLAAVGGGLSVEEAHSVACMVQLLGEDPSFQVESVRFFGKFFATGDDYYVFETKLKTPNEAQESGAVESDAVPVEVGTGANAFSYFVCHFAGGALTRLPDAKPECIRSARGVRRFLTGSLDADVSAFPLFPGREADYLRAQIARIASATVLCPTGYFAVNEDGVVEKADETPTPTAEELREISNWVHATPHVKRQGRCVLYVREAPEGEEEGFELTEEEREEGPELLASVEQDATAPHGAPWTHVSSTANRRRRHHQVFGLRSNVWPGAICAAKGSQYVNCYIGWGVKEAHYAPPPLPEISREYDAPTENDALPAPPPPAEPEEETE